MTASALYINSNNKKQAIVVLINNFQYKNVSMCLGASPVPVLKTTVFFEIETYKNG